MKALHFGAGNIGRGFIGRMILDSGFDLTFSDIDQNLINNINFYKKYEVQLVENNSKEIVSIKNIKAINIYCKNTINIIASSDLITTSVGVYSLDKIAPIIAKGILLNIHSNINKSLNIIACENKIQASSYLKKRVLEHIPQDYYNYLEEYIGFIDCTIDTIVPTTSILKKNSLFLIAENFSEWIVDKNQFKGEIPTIINMQLSNNLKYFIDRKFLTLNTGHAILAYLGWIYNYNTTYESILDDRIFNIVKGAMQESGNSLIQRYHCNEKKHLSYIDKILMRFKNPYLLDPIERIARNPLQKLRKNERLIRPLLCAIKYQLSYCSLVKGIAAAFFYNNKNDIEAKKINYLIKKYGIEKTIIKICNLNMNTKETYSIISEYICLIQRNRVN